jgi:16S rRNA (uracil1498-N3)-methyltransferase
MLARFLISGPVVTGSRVCLEGDELHHAARVARVRVGERIEVLDGRGSAAEAIVVEASRDRVDVEIGAPVSSREAPVAITLASALIAPDKYELVLQKGCELGVSRFVPVISERVETRVERVLGKLDRWERILLEATKQCGRAVLPRIEPPIGLDRLLAREEGLILFDADEATDPWPGPRVAHATLLVGPEGGFTPDEIAAAKLAGASVCSLGPRRLRAETAAIAAVALAGARFGDLLPR